MQSLSFLLVRKAQVITEIRAMGILYSILVAGGIALLLVFFMKSQTSVQGVFIAAAIITILLFAIHFSRKDHAFIKIVAKQPFQIFFAEYAVFILPLLVLSWIAYGMPLLFLVLVPALLLSVWPVKAGSTRNWNLINLIIPENNFEWKAGTRKTGILLLVIWMVALFLVFVPFASVIALWFFLLTVSSFYDAGEPREMVESYRLPEREFLINKIVSQLKTVFAFMLPVLVLSFIFFRDRWWVLLFFIAFVILNVTVFILSKYAVWRSGELNRSGSIVNAMCMLGLFLPFLLPLPVIVLLRNYRKSIVNLKPLLHDYHT